MQQQQQHTQTPFGGGGGGGLEPSRGGLTRFRSAPATWFDTLLQDDESLTSNQSLLPIPGNDSNSSILGTNATTFNSADPTFFGTAVASSGLGFFRQNSSPAEFLAQTNLASDGFFSSFGISANFDHPPLLDNTANKLQQGGRTQSSAKFSSQLKGEQSVQLPGGVTSFSDMDIDKLLDDSVPFRVRAKRGCATHPRSIAERVRRTRISDRIRKLQELVPNMDKQTNTADMLEEAVEYVKSLQKQIQELTENQRKCKCLVRD